MGALEVLGERDAAFVSLGEITAQVNRDEGDYVSARDVAACCGAFVAALQEPW